MVRLTHPIIIDAMKIVFVHARRRLEPLVAALEARPGSDGWQLAGWADRRSRPGF